jgi:hypothetical protein
MGFAYKKWYDDNKQKLLDKRKKRYHEDATFREKQLDRSRKQREAKTEPVKDGYVVPFSTAADHIGVTIWTLREWRKKDYFPEPKHRNRRLWFTDNQVLWLEKLQHFFIENGFRVSERKLKPLQELVGLIYANWNQ